MDKIDFRIIRGEKGLNATFGEITAGDFVCKSLELPFRGNKKNVSCIPAGVYTYIVLKSSRRIPYPHIWIMNVPLCNYDG